MCAVCNCSPNSKSPPSPNASLEVMFGTVQGKGDQDSVLVVVGSVELQDPKHK